jgi:hypothetical protein
MNKLVVPSVAWLGLMAIAGAGCNGASSKPVGTGGTTSAGGTDTVVSSAAGSTATGGATSAGGTVSSGGTVSAGGTVSTGGRSAGSTVSSGGISSGAATTAGAISSAGGTISTGGTTTTGGASRIGGSIGTGGTTTTGGASRIGGSIGTGGTTTTGGASRIGGSISTGGITNLGGTVSAGGATTGGTTGAPGTCQPASCGSHKWACWKMPNPTGSGLPNPASYTVANGIVHDNVTCLDWQQVESGSSYTNADAITYCASLALGGNSDWRVPTRVETESIMDWTRSPAIDAAFTAVSGFHKTGSDWILTIRQAGAGKTCGAAAAGDGGLATSGGTCAWAFNFGDGIVSNAYAAGTAGRVRCVRGNGTGEAFADPAVAPPNQYTAISADEVQDNYTGLIWQRTGNSSGLISWDQAVTYCSSLTIGGNTWRLPSVRELATLVDEAQVAPAINRTMFPSTQYGARSNNWYWASHAQRNSTTAWWGLNYDDGFTGFNAGASGAWNYWTVAYAKCVR